MDSYLYYDPPYIPKWTWISLSVSFIFCIIWVYVAAGGRLWQGLILIFLALATTVAAFTFTNIALNKYHDRMNAIGRWKDIGLTGVFVHNALVTNATCLLIATVVTFSSTLVYVWDVGMDNACIGALVVLAVELTSVMVADNIWFYKRKYIFANFFVLIIAYIGMLTNYHEGSNAVTIITYVLLVLTVLALVFKAVKVHRKVNRESPREAAKKQKKLAKKMQEQAIVAPPNGNPIITGVVNAGVVCGGHGMTSFPVPQPVVVGPVHQTQCVHAPAPQPLLVTNHYHHHQCTPRVPGQAVPPQVVVGGGPPINFYTPATIVP